jgi:hypothetical protein
MMRIPLRAAKDISARKFIYLLIDMVIMYFAKAKDIYRRPKGLGQMAYMREGLIMRLSGAFYLFNTKIQGHEKSDLALFFVWKNYGYASAQRVLH